MHFNGGRQKAKQKTFLKKRGIKFAHDLSTFPLYIDKVGFKTYAELGCQPTAKDPWPLKAPVPSKPIGSGRREGRRGKEGAAGVRSPDGSAGQQTTRTAVLFKIHELDKETNRALAQLKHDLGPASQVKKTSPSPSPSLSLSMPGPEPEPGILTARHTTTPTTPVRTGGAIR